MSTESPKTPAARLFVALDLPEAVRVEIAEWQREALGDPALRPIKPEGLHVTLCFLGHHPEPAIAKTESALVAIKPRPVAMRFQAEPAPLPRGRPGLFAIAAESEEAVALQGELSAVLAAAGLFEPEKRRFWPHVTVARVRSERLEPRKGERRGKSRPRRVSEAPKPLGQRLCEPFGAVRLALYRSILKPEGAEYESLAGVDLPPPAGGRRRGDEEDD
jgi:2'-5' RNA ligase